MKTTKHLCFSNHKLNLITIQQNSLSCVFVIIIIIITIIIYMFQQGKAACMAFLRHHINVHELAEKREMSEDELEINGHAPPQRPKTQERKFFSTKRPKRKSTRNPFRKKTGTKGDKKKK